MNKINARLKGFYCLHCGERFRIADYLTGCLSCRQKSLPVSLAPYYQGTGRIKNNQERMFRYGEFLPYPDFPSLGEGSTPLVKVKRLAEKYRLNLLYVKNEFQNPTASHKDRMSPLVIARAIGMKRKIVSAASSGNAGVSLAAYAALAGLKCKIITQPNINPIWKRAIEKMGAEIIYTVSSEERWTFLQEKVQKEGWYPATNFITPPVGSNPFGVQGYKTIAYELYEDLQGQLPVWVLIPTARGDLLWGIYQGFKELQEMKKFNKFPRLVAVEPFERINKVLAGADYRLDFAGDYRLTPSVGGTTVTYQSIQAVKDSKGCAVNILPEEVEANINEISSCGLYLESSSALLIGALKKLRKQGLVSENDCVVMVATSSGYKDLPQI